MEKSCAALIISSPESYKLHSLDNTGEIVIESSLPSSIRAALSFLSEHGKQQNSDIFCDRADSDGTLQNRPKCDDSSSVIDQKTCSHLSNINNVCAISDNKETNYVYKRRKLYRSTVTLLSAETATNNRKDSELLTYQKRTRFLAYKSQQISLATEKDDLPDSKIKVRNDGTKTLDVPDVPSTRINETKSSEVVSKSESLNLCGAREENQAIVQTFNPVVQRSNLEDCPGANDCCSSSKSNLERGPTSMKPEVDETAECSSSDIVATNLLTRNPSENEICISILRVNGLLDRASPTTARASLEASGTGDDANCSQSCKICGLLETTAKLLICDSCEEAFHLSCCNPRVKEIPIDDWYCQPCIKNKLRPWPGCTTQNSLNCTSEMPVASKRILRGRGESNIFSIMLRDDEPYTSEVRIGKGFQAEVPDWSGPISDDSSSFGEPLEMDPMKCVDLNGWNTSQSSAPSSIGNWLQCQEVLCENSGESKDIICGKWRRAPLFEVQTDDWDCFSAILWDPYHSDCAVPQELGTEEVLMHLKYIELLRSRLAKRQNPISNKSNVPEESQGK